MTDHILVRAVGDFEVYQFMDTIEEFTTFYNANLDNFSIFEIANLSEVETTEINENYTVYDLTLEHTGEHLWLIKDESTGMYEPVADEDQVHYLMSQLKEEGSEDE